MPSQNIKEYSKIINNKVDKLISSINILQMNNADDYINYNKLNKLNNLIGGTAGTNTNVVTSNDIKSKDNITFADTSIVDKVGYVELYNKLFNIYTLYKFRFSNAINLNSSFSELSNNINKIKKESNSMYKDKYIEALGNYDFESGVPSMEHILQGISTTNA